MMLDWVGLLLAAWLGHADPTGRGLAATFLPDVVFRPRDRAVSNWRGEAATHLEASYGVRANILLGREPAQVTRCVRLNNYWCIKRAGWAGEIAADGEGHVAFASAIEGADVAALLLRRYYVDYGRHTALAIISHWAPASCGFATGGFGRGVGTAARGGKAGRATADHLAVHGLGQTLRARFLAGRGRRMAGGARGRPHRSVVPDRLIGTAVRAPAIAVGLGEKPISLDAQSLASMPLTALGAPTSLPTAGPTLSCLGDGARIANYAAKAAAGITPSATDDLKLFDPGGKPTPNLARLMHNMSAVEIGPLGADTALVAAALAHMTALAGQASKAPAAKVGPAPAPAPATAAPLAKS